MGALGFQFISADAAHAWVHAYYNSYTKRMDKLTNYMTNPNMALVSYFMCAETDEEARRRADGIPFFQFALKFYNADRLGEGRDRPPPGTVDLWAEYEAWKKANPEGHAKAISSGLIGSPETIRNRLRKYSSSHVDQIIPLNQAGKNSHEHICESRELFGKEVMPEFQEMEPEHQEWKRQVFESEIELEELDTDSYQSRFSENFVQLDPVTTAAAGD